MARAAESIKEAPATVQKDEKDRGREAEKPTDVPAKGWLDILSRTKQQINEDNLSIVAAGVGFFAFVAVVPALASLIAIYALVSDPGDIGKHLEILGRMVPGEIMPLLRDQITRIVTNNTAAGISATIGILVALYSSAGATKALITGLNVAYNEEEKRSFMILNIVAYLVTLLAIFGAVAVFVLITILPVALKHMGVSSVVENLLNWLRWPLLAALFMTGLACVYRYLPSRREPKWKWVSWGAALATLLWMLGSSAFSLYVTKFGGYDQTYGSLGAVVVFLMWMYLSAFSILVGAELNSEMERQTAKDTTKGEEKALGQRGAYSADTVGPAHH